MDEIRIFSITISLSTLITLLVGIFKVGRWVSSIQKDIKYTYIDSNKLRKSTRSLRLKFEDYRDLMSEKANTNDINMVEIKRDIAELLKRQIDLETYIRNTCPKCEYISNKPDANY